MDQGKPESRSVPAALDAGPPSSKLAAPLAESEPMSHDLRPKGRGKIVLAVLLVVIAACAAGLYAVDKSTSARKDRRVADAWSSLSKCLVGTPPPKTAIEAGL